ncbi:hypothetical protein ACHAW5_006631 [Stephanodiscus triporus]|uniref:PIN-like protein n=1 Tax=Stephanodiscus triporus TaxID=2934178 RepID=A0ABD3N673_9STRA
MSAVTSVMIASASAVAKVFVILAIGYVAAIRPRPIPLMPPHAINSISKMNLYLLVIPLIYSTIASSVTLEKLSSAWFVLVSAIGVIFLSYGVASLLGRLPFFRVENKTDFDALLIAAAFPNILALPILIFPTLCEFPVVYDSFYGGEDGSTQVEKVRSCVDQSNAMIFIYFFAWNLMFWILGNPALIAAGKKRREIANAARELHLSVESVNSDDAVVKIDVHDDNEQQIIINGATDEAANDVTEEDTPESEKEKKISERRKRVTDVLQLLAYALLQTIKSPHLVALVLGFITACIPPLRDALFSPGGGLRFLGSALESLGYASASVGTLVVAASLVHEASDDVPLANSKLMINSQDESQTELNSPSDINSKIRIHDEGRTSSIDHLQQHSRNLRDSMRSRRSSFSQMSIKALAAIKRRKPTIRMHAWFIVSRLIVSPAIVCLIVMGMECGGLLDGVPSMAKMVVIVNAGLPGAQIVVLTLKSKGLSDSASIVAKVYLPSYLLSIITIAAWTSLGLMISRDDGTSFCKR